MTARKNTERPVAIMEGTNTLVSTDKEEILHHITNHLPKPLYWDGHTARRIVEAILQY